MFSPFWVIRSFSFCKISFISVKLIFFGVVMCWEANPFPIFPLTWTKLSKKSAVYGVRAFSSINRLVSSSVIMKSGPYDPTAPFFLRASASLCTDLRKEERALGVNMRGPDPMYEILSESISCCQAAQIIGFWFSRISMWAQSEEVELTQPSTTKVCCLSLNSVLINLLITSLMSLTSWLLKRWLNNPLTESSCLMTIWGKSFLRNSIA